MSTLVITPIERDLAKAEGSKLVYWKQILPKRQIEYTAKDGSRQKLNFDDNYLADLAKMDGVDSVGFLLADKDNAHTMDPERWRASVTKMEVRDDGLYGRFEFPNEQMAQAVMLNPNLGVSARIREGIAKDDGSAVSRGIIHVLGTLDPQVSGMKPWELATDLSKAGFDEVIDLSTQKEESRMTKKPISEITEADVDAMSDEELDAFLDDVLEADNLDDEANAAGADSEDDESMSADELIDAIGELATAGAPAAGGGNEGDLSKTTSRDIELANSAATEANARAREALRRMAEAEWKQERAAYVAEGVPPHLLDLAAPVLNRADEMVIDLSNTGDADINVSEIVRQLLNAAKGTVDLSTESGHSGSFKAGDGNDPDAALLAAWDSQFKG